MRAEVLGVNTKATMIPTQDMSYKSSQFQNPEEEWSREEQQVHVPIQCQSALK